MVMDATFSGAPGKDPAEKGHPGTLGTLEAVERRVLWLSTAVIDHTNRVRPNPTGLKVGGHQASSASMASIMTALWFHTLTARTGCRSSPMRHRCCTPSTICSASWTSRT